MGKPGTFDYKDEQILANNIKDCSVVRRLYGQDAVMKHLKSNLMIIVDAKDIPNQQWGNHNFIKGTAILVNDLHGFNGKIEVACRVACGRLHKLKDRIKGEKVNILDHLDLLLPKFQKVLAYLLFKMESKTVQ